MTRNELKHMLHRYRNIENERIQLLHELETLEANMNGPAGINMDGMPHGSSDGGRMINIVSRHIELQNMYRGKLNSLLDAHIQIENLIENLEPTMRIVMRYRYIECLSWEKVCEKVGYSWRQVHRYHSDALDSILKNMA